MAAVASNPKFAKKAGVPQSVGEEFIKADKGRKFAGGGEMESKKMIGKELAFMKKKGAPKSMIKHEMSRWPQVVWPQVTSRQTASPRRVRPEVWK
jgi:hypothetical protein